MKFITEFRLDLQTEADEEAYGRKLVEIINEIVPEERRRDPVQVNYIPAKRMNEVSFGWDLPVNTNNFIPYLFKMKKALKSVKWLRSHNINNIKHVYR